MGSHQIITELLREKPLCFNELKKKSGLHQEILSRKLRALEREGAICKTKVLGRFSLYWINGDERKRDQRVAELRSLLIHKRGDESGGSLSHSHSCETEIVDWLTPRVHVSPAPFEIDVDHEFPFLAPPRQHPRRVLEFIKTNYPEIFKEREKLIRKAETLDARLQELKRSGEPWREGFELKEKELWEPYQRLVSELRGAVD